MDPLPDVTKVFSMVLQYERQHERLNSSEMQSLSIVNVASGKKFVGKGKHDWGSRHCTYCGKSGHTVETCYKKHGLPPWLKNRNYQSLAVNNATTDEYDQRSEISNTEKTHTEKNSEKGELSTEECRTLMALLQRSSFQKVDSQAADHSINQVRSNHGLINDEGPFIQEDWFGQAEKRTILLGKGQGLR